MGIKNVAVNFEDAIELSGHFADKDEAHLRNWHGYTRTDERDEPERERWWSRPPTSCRISLGLASVLAPQHCSIMTRVTRKVLSYLPLYEVVDVNYTFPDGARIL